MAGEGNSYRISGEKDSIIITDEPAERHVMYKVQPTASVVQHKSRS
jgi:hypothetical protein